MWLKEVLLVHNTIMLTVTRQEVLLHSCRRRFNVRLKTNDSFVLTMELQILVGVKLSPRLCTVFAPYACMIYA